MQTGEYEEVVDRLQEVRMCAKDVTVGWARWFVWGIVRLVPFYGVLCILCLVLIYLLPPSKERFVSLKSALRLSS